MGWRDELYFIKELKIVNKLIYKIKKYSLLTFILYLDPRTRWLQVRPPKNDEELKKMFQLRYKVYCEEYNFLNKSDYPDGLEKDEYDVRSDYLIAVDRYDNMIGCVRVVKPSGEPLPTHTSFDIKAELHLHHLQKTVEVSRLIVEKKYRSTKVGIALYRGIYRYCTENDYQYIVEAMENELARWINYLFLRFIPISDPILYYSTWNRAYIADVNDVSNAVKKDDYPLYKYLNWKLPKNKFQTHVR